MTESILKSSIVDEQIYPVNNPPLTWIVCPVM